MSCGQTDFTAQDDEQEFTSPNYPNNYPNNANCRWNINASGKSAEISFTNFATEAEYDEVKLYLDGSLAGNLSGNITSQPFQFNQEASITFTSDGSIQDTGFRAVFKTGWYKPSNVRIQLQIVCSFYFLAFNQPGNFLLFHERSREVCMSTVKPLKTDIPRRIPL